MEDLIYKYRSSDKKIALTFDDGPDPIYTPALLDLFKATGAKATFFALGENLKKYPDLAKRMTREGHELANHTYSHPDLVKLDAGQIHEELKKTELLIRSATGKKPRLFRPPYYSYNRQVIKAAQQFGYVTVMSSIETNDYKRPGVSHIVDAVISRLNRGEIVLMHDSGGDRRQTVEAVKILLEKLGRRKYECVSVSRLLRKS